MMSAGEIGLVIEELTEILKEKEEERKQKEKEWEKMVGAPPSEFDIQAIL